PEAAEVFQNTVVNDAQLPGRLNMRVRVPLGDATVGRPARVSKSNRRRREIDRSVADLASLLFDSDMSVDSDGHAPGVVATVLQALQRVEHHDARVGRLTDVSEDSTHEESPSRRHVRMSGCRQVE